MGYSQGERNGADVAKDLPFVVMGEERTKCVSVFPSTKCWVSLVVRSIDRLI